MNLKLITLAICLGTTLQVLAQGNNSAATGAAAKTNLETLQNNVGATRTFDNRYEGTKGTPFMNDKFAKAKIKLSNNVLLEEISFKYNTFDNTIIYKDEKMGLLAFDARNVDQLVYSDPITGADVILGKLDGLATANPKAADKLVVFLFEGEKVKFASLLSKELIKADYKGSTYSSGRTYDEFFDKTEYYIKGKNGTVEKVKLNKKNLLNSLSDKQAEIKNYIAKEKIDASTEAGWIQTLAYYETL